MTNTHENKQNADAATQKKGCVATVRDQTNGAVAANIYLGQSLDGFDYHYFELARAYKPRNAKNWKYTSRFFSRNAAAISRVAIDAGNKCEELDTELEGLRPST